jgi:hypothetical protein
MKPPHNISDDLAQSLTHSGISTSNEFMKRGGSAVVRCQTYLAALPHSGLASNSIQIERDLSDARHCK